MQLAILHVVIAFDLALGFVPEPENCQKMGSGFSASRNLENGINSSSAYQELFDVVSGCLVSSSTSAQYCLFPLSNQRVILCYSHGVK